MTAVPLTDAQRRARRSAADADATIRTSRGFLPFEKARAFARSLNFKGGTEWVTWTKSGARPDDIPVNPDQTYKHKGWVNWGDWLGTGTIATYRRKYLPFEEARTYVRSLHLKNQNAWWTWTKSGARPDDIPTGPHRIYKHKGWVSYGDWLGTNFVAHQNRRFLPFEKARALARSLGLKTKDDWGRWIKSGQCPDNIPTDPRDAYEDTGWVSWGDWLREDGANSPNQWKLAAVRRLVASLSDHLASLTPAELYALFQQNGLLAATQGPGHRFARALMDRLPPPAELEKFAAGTPSQVDAIVASGGDALDDPDADLAEVEVGEDAEDTPALPLVDTAATLDALGRVAPVVASADQEAAEFFIASAVRKMFTHAFDDAPAAVAQAEAADPDNEYAQRAAQQFLAEYHDARRLALPAGYAFPFPPNLMQRLIASQVQRQRRRGNWSGMGAGKTLAAVLASRVIDAGLTVVLCPNSVVGDDDHGWAKTITDAFPDSAVSAKTWDLPAPGGPTGFEAPCPRYLILNYEMLQQPDSPQRVQALVEAEAIDFVVIDEVQYVKQRDLKAVTQRRTNVAMLITQAAQRNPELAVLGMSGTPVVNNLQEAKSLIELITGLEHPELGTRPTVGDCMGVYQQLVMLGVRQVPRYDTKLRPVEEWVELSADAREALRALGRNASILETERILTRERLPAILKWAKPGTFIYTELLDGIAKTLRDALLAKGLSVGFYTGEDKSGLAAFLRREVDVLIGSSAIGTGVDGLQQVCDRVIFNVLPWTAAQFDQVQARVYRQGQGRDVTVVLPLTYVEEDGARRSYCQKKRLRLRFKRSVADAAVDGVVPIGHLRSPEQAHRDYLGWLQRLDDGEVKTVARTPLLIPFPPAPDADPAVPRVRRSEFSRENQRLNTTRSEVTHARFRDDPDAWVDYHARYREQRQDWTLVPVEEVIRYYAGDAPGLVIGDFGAGEAQLAGALGDRHTVHSFDHVAIDDRVTACDMAHTPLPDASLDAAVFSLSLMGANFGDYLREAARTLKRDRVLHIYEATTRFGSTEAEVEANRRAFARSLRDFGFAGVEVTHHWKFTYLKAYRSGRAPLADATITFKQPVARRAA